jgi:hypothetical protein
MSDNAAAVAEVAVAVAAVASPANPLSAEDREAEDIARATAASLVHQSGAEDLSQQGSGASAAAASSSSDLLMGDESKGAREKSPDVVDMTASAQSSRLSSASSSSANDKLNEQIAAWQRARAAAKHEVISSNPNKLAQLSGIDKALGLLIVYNDSGSTNDSFRVTIDKSEDALVAGVLAFLQTNHKVLSSWIKLLGQSIHNALVTRETRARRVLHAAAHLLDLLLVALFRRQG